MKVLIEMSIQTSILIVIILALRALLINRLPKITFVILWGICTLKLLLPFSIQSAFSFFNWIPVHAQKSASLPSSAVIEIMAQPEKASSLPFFIWIVGVAIFAVALIMSYVYHRCRFRFSMPIEETDSIKRFRKQSSFCARVRIRSCERISSPVTYGLFRPIILLPNTMNLEDSLRVFCVLEHERTHIQRGDNVWKILFSIALCIHWFNPFVWLFILFSNRDLELSCDEQVIHRLGRGYRTSYALTLIHMEEKRLSPMPLCSGFSRNFVSERVESIMKLQKKSVLGIVVAIAVIATTTAVFATTASTTPLSKDAYLGDIPNAIQVDEVRQMSKAEFEAWLKENKKTEEYKDILQMMEEDQFVALYGSIDGVDDVQITLTKDAEKLDGSNPDSKSGAAYYDLVEDGQTKNLTKTAE